LELELLLQFLRFIHDFSLIIHKQTFDLLLLNLLFLLGYAVRLVRRTKSNTVLLSGLTGSGKTVLFYQVSVLA